MRLTVADRLRCRVALFFDLGAILMGLLLVVAVLFVVSYEIESFVSQYFSFAGGVPRR
jgi:hypothetical protein